MAHPNEELVFQAFRAVCEGDAEAANESLHDDVVLHYPGRSVLAGDFEGKEGLLGWTRRRSEHANGKCRVGLTGAWGDDERGVALWVSRVESDGGPTYERAVAVFSLRDRRVAEVWVAPIDLYASDELWS
jgi:ketosteroid isomerase-like protein